jgi:hypothetical protein
MSVSVASKRLFYGMLSSPPTRDGLSSITSVPEQVQLPLLITLRYELPKNRDPWILSAGKGPKMRFGAPFYVGCLL